MLYKNVIFNSNGYSLSLADCRNSCVCCQAQSPLPPCILTHTENESRPRILSKFGKISPGKSVYWKKKCYRLFEVRKYENKLKFMLKRLPLCRNITSIWPFS